MNPELKKAIEHLRLLTDFAYQQGYHEMGYDPVATVATALEQIGTVKLAVLDEVIELCSKPMSIPFPMRAVLNKLREKYEGVTE